ncbi:MAG: MFS transporter, partial [Actinobacteria bacterium]|nr:MFS transporter [Actinomycetota bacterium]
GVVVQAIGMGFTTAPSTGAIMRSLPLHKAGVGSAVNDTTRELGGALGVAVLGSLVASQFRSSMHGAVAGLPAKATHSLAEALQHASAVGGAQGGAIAHAARGSFTTAFDSTLWIGMVAVIVASGLVSWLLRPAATERVDAEAAAEARLALEAA